MPSVFLPLSSLCVTLQAKGQEKYNTNFQPQGDSWSDAHRLLGWKISNVSWPNTVILRMRILRSEEER